MNYKILTLTLFISLISSSTLFLKEDESHKASYKKTEKKAPAKYVEYSSFGDFFYDEDAIDMSTEMG